MSAERPDRRDQATGDDGEPLPYGRAKVIDTIFFIALWARGGLGASGNRRLISLFCAASPASERPSLSRAHLLAYPKHAKLPSAPLLHRSLPSHSQALPAGNGACLGAA